MESRPSKSGSSLRIKIKEKENLQVNSSKAADNGIMKETEENNASDLDKSTSSVGSIDLEDVEFIENIGK